MANFKWVVVHTKVRNEDLAKKHMQNQNIEVYYPTYKKLCRHARKTYTVLFPLFPRYLFAHVDLNESWGPINSTHGVSYLLINNQGEPSIISDQIITELRQQHDDLGCVTLEALNLFRPGEKVLICEGTFKNQVAVYEKMTDQQRVQLLINMMQREVRVEIPAYAVERY